MLQCDLIACHRIILLHEPGFLLVLFPEGACMVGLVLADVDFVLTLDAKEVALPCLQARKLLHGDQWLAH